MSSKTINIKLGLGSPNLRRHQDYFCIKKFHWKGYAEKHIFIKPFSKAIQLNMWNALGATSVIFNSTQAQIIKFFEKSKDFPRIFTQRSNVPNFSKIGPFLRSSGCSKVLASFWQRNSSPGPKNQIFSKN